MDYFQKKLLEKIETCISRDEIEKLSEKEIDKFIENNISFKNNTFLDELPKDIIGEIIKKCESSMKVKFKFEFNNDQLPRIILKFNNNEINGLLFMHLDQHKNYIRYEYADIKSTIFCYRKHYEYRPKSSVFLNINENIKINYICNPCNISLFEGYTKIILTPSQYLKSLLKAIENVNKNIQSKYIKRFYISEQGMCMFECHKNNF